MFYSIFKYSLVIIVITLSSNADAFERIRVEMKCYVELLDGETVIHYATVPEKKVAQLSKSLINRKISVIGTRDKKVVTKVNECVESKMAFKSLLARDLQNSTVH